MSLEQEIEDTKAKLAEALEAEKEPEKVEEKPVEEIVEEVPVEEITKEEPKEEKLDDSGFARLRRESAANKRRAEEAEAKLVAQQAEVEETVDTVAPELDSIIRDHRASKAEKEFKVFESDVRGKNPEYDAITAEYAQALSGAIKIQNPRLSNVEIAELTKETLLQKAGKYLRDGHANPVEELFFEAKELGFTGASFKQKPEAETKETPQPDMKKLAENRKRSAGTAGASGESKTDMNRAYIVQNGMPTNEEWQRLTPSQKREILQSA